MTEKSLYTPDDYDQNMCLKPSFGMALTLFIGIRHIVMALVPIILEMRNSDSNMSFISDLASPIFIAGDLSALAVIIAWSRRMPNASKIWERIWRKGKLLLLVSFLIQAIAFTYLSVIPEISNLSSGKRLSLFPFYYLFLTLIFIYYISASQRIKDVFADWPQKNHPRTKG